MATKQPILKKRTFAFHSHNYPETSGYILRQVVSRSGT